MLTFKDDDAVGLVKQRLGEEGAKAVEEGFGGVFQSFPKLEEAVERDVQWLRGNKAIPQEVKVSGWVYEVETGIEAGCLDGWGMRLQQSEIYALHVHHICLILDTLFPMYVTSRSIKLASLREYRVPKFRACVFR